MTLGLVCTPWRWHCHAETWQSEMTVMKYTVCKYNWYIKWKYWFKFRKWIIVRMSFTVHKKARVLSYYKQSLMFWSPYTKPDTYLPRAARRNSVPSGWPRCVRAMLVMPSLREHFRMACRRPFGAISIVMALWGICCDASSKYTTFSRLLVWYSADEYCTAGKLWALGVTDEHTHREDRDFGCGISYTQNCIRWLVEWDMF